MFVVTIAALFAAAPVRAQESPSIQLLVSPPSGSCSQNLPDQQVIATGALYSCQNGTWTQIGVGASGPPTGAAGGGLSGNYPNPAVGATISVMNHGAACNWSGAAGTDDTTAFQASLTAAGAIYTATGTTVKVTYPTNCTLGTGSGQTTIMIPSGAVLDGAGGSIFVPAQSANPLFESLSAGTTQFNNNTITFVTSLSGCAPTVNNAACAAYRWDSATPGSSTTFNDFTATGNVIYNAGWGILVGPQSGTDCLQHVHVNHNTLANLPGTANYSYNDSIHLGGCVSNFEVVGNIIQGKHDAGIAVTSEVNGSSQLRQCQNGTISGNSIYENAVGIDISGCSHVQVTGNWVWADQAISNSSNPAFRQIYYNALPSYNNITGNTFQNYQGTSTDYGAKFDCSGGCGNNAGTIYYSYSSFTDNRIPNMYVRGSGISVSGNTFQNNIGSAGVGASSVLEIDWDSTNGNGSLYTMIGPNTWMNPGNINTDSRSDIYFGSIYYPQVAKTGTITLYYPTWAQSPDMTVFHSTFSQLVQNAAVATPTVAAGAGAGTSPTINVNGSTDQAGTVFLTTGTSPTAGAQVFQVNFQNFFNAIPRCTLSPANALTQQLVGAAAPYLGGPGNGESLGDFYVTAGATALQAGASYEWTWLCIG